MNRRTVLAALPLTLPFGGCLAADGDDASDDDESNADDNEDSSAENDRSCYDVLQLWIVALESHVDWDETDVTVVPSDDDRIADVSVLQELFDEIGQSEGRITYEYSGIEFEAVRETVVEPEGIAGPVSTLPTEPIPDVPPGPVVEHEGDRFVVVHETWHECEE